MNHGLRDAPARTGRGAGYRALVDAGGQVVV